MPDKKSHTVNATGGCLCGKVRYNLTGPLRDIICCHCQQCRKTSGHFVAASAAHDDDLHIVDQGGLTWFSSSKTAKRGFCKFCGGNLFWKDKTKDNTSIMAGTLDLPTNLNIERHIYVADASDYVSFHPHDVCFDQEG